MKREKKPLWDRETWLYRAYDAQGTLLYVGVSENVVARIRAGHRKSSAWYAEAAWIRLELYADRRSAIALESLTIAQETPIWNEEPGVRYLPDDGWSPPAPIETRTMRIPERRKYND